MGRSTIECHEEGCTKQTARWRQCPKTECSHDVGFCEDHGGDLTAVTAMSAHIEEYRIKHKGVNQKPLWKTTLIVWSEKQPPDGVSLYEMAKEADGGVYYNSRSKTVYVEEPHKDPDCDNASVFF